MSAVIIAFRPPGSPIPRDKPVVIPLKPAEPARRWPKDIFPPGQHPADVISERRKKKATTTVVTFPAPARPRIPDHEYNRRGAVLRQQAEEWGVTILVVPQGGGGAA